MDLVEILSFLFMLSTMELGRVWSDLLGCSSVRSHRQQSAGVLRGASEHDSDGNARRFTRLRHNLAAKGMSLAAE